MRRWLILWLCAWSLACAQGVEAVDDRGVRVRLPAPPQRVVTLLPSLTETVCELGACARLVGVDDYSNWPASVQRLPRLGGLDDASIERIVALRPDVVLLSATSRAMPRLESLGVRTVGLELKTLADVRRGLQKVAQVLGSGDAEGVWRRIEASIDGAAASVPAPLRGTSVYVEVGPGPYAASESSHIGEILRRLGVRNVVPGELGSVPKLNPEFVVRADPHLILLADRRLSSLHERPGWSRMRAVREGRICSFTPEQGDVVVRPGPRLGEAARLLAGCIVGGGR